VNAYNGDAFEFMGEIYGGAIFPTLERDDYMPLPNLKPKGTSLLADRPVFLHSSEHYKVIRKAKGDPDIASIQEIRQPSKFAEFSRKNYLNIIARYAKQN